MDNTLKNSSDPFVFSNGDGFVTPVDILNGVNFLNSMFAAEGELPAMVPGPLLQQFTHLDSTVRPRVVSGSVRCRMSHTSRPALQAEPHGVEGDARACPDGSRRRFIGTVCSRRADNGNATKTKLTTIIRKHVTIAVAIRLARGDDTVA